LDFARLVDGGSTNRQPMTGEYAAAWLPAMFVPITGILFAAIFIVLVGRVITKE